MRCQKCTSTSRPGKTKRTEGSCKWRSNHGQEMSLTMEYRLHGGSNNSRTRRLQSNPVSNWTQTSRNESIGKNRNNCHRLANVFLAVDSEIVRIGDGAFWNCLALRSLFLPSSVEFVGKGCFAGCIGLSSLTFGSPSHLRELLDLPRSLSGFISIPDSVETLVLFGRLRRIQTQVLSFGVESRLNEVRKATVKTFHNPINSLLVRRSFLVVSSRSLKAFRMKLEFEAAN
jgi:hypothetical protein